MSWCPKCRTEYRDEFTHCADCGAELVDELPPEETEAAQAPLQQVYLTTIQSDQEFELFTGLLHMNRIPFYSIDKDTGSYMRIYMGFSVYGQDVYVMPQHYAVCSQLLAQMQGSYSDEEVEAAWEEAQEKGIPEELQDDPDAEPVSSGYGVLKGFGIFFGVLILLSILGKLFGWGY